MNETWPAWRCPVIVRGLAIVLLVAACDQGVKKAPAATSTPPRDASAPDAIAVAPRPMADCPRRELVPDKPAEVLASLRRTSCYGPCPVYQLVVYLDGRVDFVGTRYVAQCEATDRLAAKQLAALTRMFEDKHFLALKDTYTDQDATDAPTMEIVYQPTPWTKKRVEHYGGDMDAPPVLDEIEDEFDRIVGTARWTTIDYPY